MKKALLVFLAAGCVLSVAVCASANNIQLIDFLFDPSGSGLGGVPGVFGPIDQIAFSGVGVTDYTPPYADGSAPGPGDTFRNIIAMNATGFRNDGAPVSNVTTGLGISYEITAVADFTGLNTGLNGTEQHYIITDGTLDIYLDTTRDFGGTEGFYGADDPDSVRIASFQFKNGNGTLDSGGAGLPVGEDAGAVAWFYADPGVWYLEDGTGLNDAQAFWAVGMARAQYSVESTPDPNFVSTLSSHDPAFELTAEENFFVVSNGSLSPGITPEPATLLLTGSGLIGLAGAARRKRK